MRLVRESYSKDNMIISKKVLARRTLLRGIGASVALPLLDAMVPPLTELIHTPVCPPRRLGFVYAPMGADMSAWIPVSKKMESGDGNTELL